MPRAWVTCALGVVLAAVWFPLSARAEDPCKDPRNLTYNCQFDVFGPAPGGEVPQGWWPFVLSGHPAFDRASDTPKEPALRIWSDGEPFTAGIYQEVSGVQPGATYEAFIGWAVFQSEGPEMGRSIGIDPRGGTDPAAPSVVWSPEVWEKKRTNPELRIRAVAEGDRITVFVQVDHPRTYGADQAFLDAVCLMRDESAPLVSVGPTAVYTATPAPTDTATPSAPTPTTAVATDAPAPTAAATTPVIASVSASEDGRAPAMTDGGTDPAPTAEGTREEAARPSTALASAGAHEVADVPGTPADVSATPGAIPAFAATQPEALRRPPPTMWVLASAPLALRTPKAIRQMGTSPAFATGAGSEGWNYGWMPVLVFGLLGLLLAGGVVYWQRNSGR